MLILGIDPGTIKTGFGIINYEKNVLTYITSGVIKLPKFDNIPEKLGIIYDELFSLIKTHQPNEFSIETAFYGKNVQSTLKIGYARGVSLLAAVQNRIPISEYSPRTVKQSVVGKGAASKEQVQFMVLRLLNIVRQNITFDETDALAIAICHALRMGSLSPKKGSWKDFIEKNPNLVIK